MDLWYEGSTALPSHGCLGLGGCKSMGEPSGCQNELDEGRNTGNGGWRKTGAVCKATVQVSP